MTEFIKKKFVPESLANFQAFNKLKPVQHLPLLGEKESQYNCLSSM